MAPGFDHTCAKRSDGTLWCRGFNGSGQLGVGDTTRRLAPAYVKTLLSGINGVGLSVGLDHTCITDLDLWCWGGNAYGQLGLGDTSTRLTPVEIQSNSQWTSNVSGGKGHTCARQPSFLYCWGNNSHGQLGLGHTDERHVPTNVPAGTGGGWTGVSVGSLQTCAKRGDGTLWCWGNNFSGQLGLGDKVNRHSPTKVGTAATWQTVSAGTNHACAPRTDGTLWCWGRNFDGQLGLGDTTERLTPTLVPFPG